METNGQVFIEDLPGNVQLTIRGSHPTHPWVMVLTHQAARALGLELIHRAERAGGTFPVSANVSSGSQPVRRPPKPMPSRQGPESSVDGGSAPSGPTPPSNTQPDLLGDDFG